MSYNYLIKKIRESIDDLWHTDLSFKQVDNLLVYFIEKNMIKEYLKVLLIYNIEYKNEDYIDKVTDNSFIKTCVEKKRTDILLSFINKHQNQKQSLLKVIILHSLEYNHLDIFYLMFNQDYEFKMFADADISRKAIGLNDKELIKFLIPLYKDLAYFIYEAIKLHSDYTLECLKELGYPTKPNELLIDMLNYHASASDIFYLKKINIPLTDIAPASATSSLDIDKFKAILECGLMPNNESFCRNFLNLRHLKHNSKDSENNSKTNKKDKTTRNIADEHDKGFLYKDYIDLLIEYKKDFFERLDNKPSLIEMILTEPDTFHIIKYIYIKLNLDNKPRLFTIAIENNLFYNICKLKYIEDINGLNSNGNTPVIEAILKNNPGILNLLLRHGADPNIPGANGMYPLNYTHDRKMHSLLKKYSTTKVELKYLR